MSDGYGIVKLIEVMKHIDWVIDGVFISLYGDLVNIKLRYDVLKEISYVCKVEKVNDFIVSYTDISDLRGSPRKVYNNFVCSGCNNLKNFIGSPRVVMNDFICSDCGNLKNFIGAPRYVGGNIISTGCVKLKSLKGISKVVEGNYIDYSGCCNLEDIDNIFDIKFSGILCNMDCNKIKINRKDLIKKIIKDDEGGDICIVGK